MRIIGKFLIRVNGKIIRSIHHEHLKWLVQVLKYFAFNSRCFDACASTQTIKELKLGISSICNKKL